MKIEDFRVEPLVDSRFVRPALVRYRQNGEPRSWEIIRAHDSVAVLIFDRDRDAFVLVRQFRPAVYLHDGKGMTVELCAGIVDKEASLKRIAKEEVMEETGYEIDEANLEKITSFYTSVGFAGSKQTLYYAEVDASMKRGPGGGVEEESIEVVELPLSRARAFMFDETVPKTPGLLFAFMWFFEKKGSHGRQAL